MSDAWYQALLNIETKLDAIQAAISGQGGPSSAVTLANGADVTEGNTADAAVTGDNSGTQSAKLRGLNKVMGDNADANTVASIMGRLTKLRDLLTDTFGSSTPISAATTFSGIPTIAQLAANSYATLPNNGYQDTFLAQIDVASAFVGTISFYGIEPDGSKLQLINAHQRNSATNSSNTAINTGAVLNQVWEGSIAGFKAIYVVCGPFTSGSASVTLGLTAANYAHAIINTVAQNLTQVGGSALALGQTTKSASIPVTLPSDASIPINTGTPTETAVSVGVSNVTALAANANRKFLLLVNDSNNTIYVTTSGTNAALNTGTRLNANGGSILFDRYVPPAAIKAIATGASSNLLVTEG